MRHLYVVKTGDHTHGHHHLFRDWAAIDNEDGTSLLSVRFHGDDEQEYFENLEGVHGLGKSQKIPEHHIKSLSHLGVQSGHTTEDVLRLARLRYRAM